MQTFMPHQDLEASAQCLDRSRLNKQRVELLQICNALDPAKQRAGWRAHPAVCMFKTQGGLTLLEDYTEQICEECRVDGLADNANMLGRFRDFFDYIRKGKPRERCQGDPVDLLASNPVTYNFARPPWWFGHPLFHYSHRANLLFKDQDYYERFFGHARDVCKGDKYFNNHFNRFTKQPPYVWPIHSHEYEINGVISPDRAVRVEILRYKKPRRFRAIVIDSPCEHTLVETLDRHGKPVRYLLQSQE